MICCNSVCKVCFYDFSTSALLVDPWKFRHISSSSQKQDEFMQISDITYEIVFQCWRQQSERGVKICIKISKKIVAVIDKMEEIFST